MNLKSKLKIFCISSTIISIPIMIHKFAYNENNSLTFEEKRMLFWQKKVYDKKVDFFIKIKSYNWDELIINRDRFFVYFGKRSNIQCLEFVSHLSYIARKLGTNIYYVDVNNQETRPILKNIIEKLKIDNFPAFLHFNRGNFKKYNFDEELEKFILKNI
ncbi:hypothetical protein [Ligilactobacillus cholophilus]|uniref:hypothetical protein n=1 Tax=Ligilactobacillus cholophilus TaxID=3050131 RepID=UPI0025B0DE7E|nr:hypothetical protein [Ligilactobacillus cholophilus]